MICKSKEIEEEQTIQKFRIVQDFDNLIIQLEKEK